MSFVLLVNPSGCSRLSLMGSDRFQWSFTCSIRFLGQLKVNQNKIVFRHLTGKVVIQLLYLPKTTLANVLATTILGHRIASLSCSDQTFGQHDVWAGPLYLSDNTA